MTETSKVTQINPYKKGAVHARQHPRWPYLPQIVSSGSTINDLSEMPACVVLKDHYDFAGGYQNWKGLRMNCLFVQIRCRPGTAYSVATQIVLREIHSELYSTSGDYDLLMKLYIPNEKDIGMFINDNLLNIEGIERTYTTQTFKVF